MTCTPIDLIGHALLAGTLHVRDFDFRTDRVMCLSVALTPTGPSEAGCLLYRDGFRAGADHDMSVRQIAAIAPLFVTAAAEPFACRDLREMAGLADRLLDLLAQRALFDRGQEHYHVHEHWLGTHGKLQTPTHETLTAARADMSARAERYRHGYAVEGNPLVGYVISHRADTGVIQVVPCHGTSC